MDQKQERVTIYLPKAAKEPDFIAELRKFQLEQEIHIERMKWLAGMYYPQRDGMFRRFTKWLSSKLRIR